MGVLSGYRVIELAGLGPCPLAGMLLADMGAEVIVIDREGELDPLYAKDMSRRGKKSIVINLKSKEGLKIFLNLVESADALIEGFRPGVTEKLGIGPEQCHKINPSLVYGRMTGWGQTGPLSQTAGHDINYIALNGVLHAIGRKGEKPVVPLNLVGDYGGGSMFLVTGVLGALLEVKISGKGQVIDAAMIEGSANLMWMCHSFHAAKGWDFSERESNLLDGGAFFYDTYETSDHKYIAIGAIEPQFFAKMVQIAGLDKALFTAKSQADSKCWPLMKKELAKAIKQKSREEWGCLFDQTDACVSPILSAEEALEHPHNQFRKNYITVDGYQQPAPAPRFSRNPSEVKHGLHKIGEDTEQILTSLGLDKGSISELKSLNAVK